jgi:hypothetical protein
MSSNAHRDRQLLDIFWTAKGGQIDRKGGFKADADEGEFLIEAAAGNVDTYSFLYI